MDLLIFWIYDSENICFSEDKVILGVEQLALRGLLDLVIEESGLRESDKTGHGM